MPVFLHIVGLSGSSECASVAERVGAKRENHRHYENGGIHGHEKTISRRRGTFKKISVRQVPSADKKKMICRFR